MSQEDKLNEIYNAVIGNEKMGQEGIIPRLNKVEKYQKSDEIYKAKVAGGLLIGVPLIDVFLHWLGKHI
jgi:hypothetical protein